jgi:hypothetical protein
MSSPVCDRHPRQRQDSTLLGELDLAPLREVGTSSIIDSLPLLILDEGKLVGQTACVSCVEGMASRLVGKCIWTPCLPRMPPALTDMKRVHRLPDDAIRRQTSKCRWPFLGSRKGSEIRRRCELWGAITRFCALPGVMAQLKISTFDIAFRIVTGSVFKRPQTWGGRAVEISPRCVGCVDGCYRGLCG